MSSSDETTRRPELCPAKRALIEKRLRGKSGGLAKAGAIPRRPGRGFARLSFAQQRLWFIDQLEPDNLAYNLTSVLRLKGRFNLPAFKRSAEEIARRHEGRLAREPFELGTRELEIVVARRLRDLGHPHST